MEQNIGTSVYALIAMFMGGYITYKISRHYYVKATDDLKVETDKIRKLSNLILCALENKGLARLQRDENGNIVGFSLLEVAEHDNLSVRDAQATQIANKKAHPSKASE